MKLVADENIPYLDEFFGHLGEIVPVPGRTMTKADVEQADVLLVRSVTQVNQALLAASHVKFVGTCTIGVDHLDLDYLARQNIRWASAPGCNAGGVVQYVLSALASLDERCFEQKVGVIGCGNVGGRLVRALQAIGIDVKAYDPFLPKSTEFPLTDLGEVLACDVVSMHTPYTVQGRFPTRHMLDQNNLPFLKPNAVLLNAGRGGALHNEALKQLLQGGAELRVVLDVWEGEPDIDLELMELCAFGTPHIAGYSYEGRINGSAMVYQALAQFLNLPKDEIWHHTNTVYAQALGPAAEIQCHDLTEAIIETYDIRADDLRTRAQLKAASVPGQEFDSLRKTYPVRREFSHFRVATKNNELRRILMALGFQI